MTKQHIPQKKKTKNNKKSKKYLDHIYEKRYIDGVMKPLEKKQREIKQILQNDFQELYDEDYN